MSKKTPRKSQAALIAELREEIDRLRARIVALEAREPRTVVVAPAVYPQPVPYIPSPPYKPCYPPQPFVPMWGDNGTVRRPMLGDIQVQC